MITCKEEGCVRTFIDAAAANDHADSVHTYDEIRQQVSQAVRAKYGNSGMLNTPNVYVWVSDLTDSWVVFEVETGNNCGLWQTDYEIDDSGNVTLGEPKQVVRKIVYVPAPSN